MTALIVLAKQPIPGRVKTRFTPPCTPAEAAALARAALDDTLETVTSMPGIDRRVLVIDGEPTHWQREHFEVFDQCDGGLDRRLIGAFTAAAPEGRALLIGMDTPQLTVADLLRALDALEVADAALGPATDGGYWTIGFRACEELEVGPLFAGVPMSTPATFAAQRDRLCHHRLTVATLATMTDADDLASADVVAAQAPHSRFARALAAVGRITPARS